jgi:ABC-type transport system involved in multi-copper enzyme maturation permease subunit
MNAFRILLRADLRYALHSSRGVLFLVFYGVFWAWVFTRLAGGGAQALAGPEAGMIAGLIFGEDVARLFREQSPTMAAFFVIALWATPLFATMVGCDQTASDLASKHLRFLIPRTGRGSIYLARYVGAAVLLAAAQVVATVLAAIVASLGETGAAGDGVMFVVRIAAVLVVYSAAFVALFAPLTAAIPAPAVVALTGLGTYAVLVILAGTVKSRWPWMENVMFLTPGGFKTMLLEPGAGASLTALAGLASLSAVYLAAGWSVFRGRDA